jgi:hypothetical protein
LDVPWELFWFVWRLLYQHRKMVGTRRGRRALSVYRQTQLVLRRLRDRPDYASLARDLRVSVSTAHRYGREGIEVLAAHAPDLSDLVAEILRRCRPYVIVDGTLITTDAITGAEEKNTRARRLAHIRAGHLDPAEQPAADLHARLARALHTLIDAKTHTRATPETQAAPTKRALRAVAEWNRPGRDNDPTYSGKHHTHGMNVQVVSGPTGGLAFVSEPALGRTYDSIAVAETGLPQAMAQAGIPVLADLAYISIPDWHTPHKKRNVRGATLTADQHRYNRVHAGLRFPVERAISAFKGHWRILQHHKDDPHHTATTAKACLVLTKYLDGSHHTPHRLLT